MILFIIINNILNYIFYLIFIVNKLDIYLAILVIYSKYLVFSIVTKVFRYLSIPSNINIKEVPSIFRVV